MDVQGLSGCLEQLKENLQAKVKVGEVGLESSSRCFHYHGEKDGMLGHHDH